MVTADTASKATLSQRDAMSKIVVMEKEVAALGDISREELAERWTKTYGHPPPKGARRDFLLRAAAWHKQASRLGGLTPDTRRLLRAATAQMKKQFAAQTEGCAAEPDASASSESTKPRKQLSPGTRLFATGMGAVTSWMCWRRALRSRVGCTSRCRQSPA
jgi:hypothetical protein